MVRRPAVQNLGIQPVELVPVETRPGFVDAVETKTAAASRKLNRSSMPSGTDHPNKVM